MHCIKRSFVDKKLEPEDQNFKVNKVFVTTALTLCVSALGSAAKAFIDVENLKTKVEYTEQAQIDIKTDIREIRNDIKEILKRVPKEG